MKRISMIISAACAVLGSGAILLTGMKSTSGMEEWIPLNSRVESVVNGQPADNQGREPSNQVAADANTKATTEPSGTDKEAGVAPGDNSVASGDSKGASGAVNPVSSTEMKTVNSSPGKETVSVDSGSSKAGSGEATDASGVSVRKINVNTAGLSELTNIPGIGEKKAQAIMDYRTQHGPFQKVTDLDKVKGIGAKMLEKMRPYIEL